MWLFTLILCILNISSIHSFAFIDYPLQLERGNRIIHASLTDMESGEVWSIEERIALGDRIEGRIDVTSSKLKEMVNIFYSYKSNNDDGKRLIMQNKECDLSIYKSDWTKYFPEVTKSLTNMILLLGPSFILRFTDSDWRQGNDEVIRGALMHSASLILAQRLNVTVYYKGDHRVEIGVSQPSRIVLAGYDPNSLTEEEAEKTLVMDIYLQSITYQDLSELVQPTPGIGCPNYLQSNIKLPSISVDKVHFLAKDLSNKEPELLKEIHADVNRNVLRSSEIKYGYSTVNLYDYELGIRYLISQGDCLTYGADLNSPGIDRNTGIFSLSSLLWMDGTFQYLGQVVFEHRASFIAHVWESIETNETLASGKYEKVVTTHYLAPSVKETVLSGFILLATTRNAYNKTKEGNFELIEWIHRDYYDFEIDEPEDEYENAFQLGECYTDETKRLTLTIHITCDMTKTPNCIKNGQDSIYIYREVLMEKIDAMVYGLSPLRVVDLEFAFTKERIEADVTFVEAPDITSSLLFDYQYINLKAIKLFQQETSTTSEQECLKFQSTFYDSASAVIYCKDGNRCMSTVHPETIKELEAKLGGTMCTIYSVPLKNLHRLGQEKSLEDIHDHILSFIPRAKFTLSDERSGDFYTYEISDVVANDKLAKENERKLFDLLTSSRQLVLNGFDIIEVPNVKRFSDCYQACSRSEEILCETFSFCEDKDATKCIVSTLNRNQVEPNMTVNSSCKTYAKNYLMDYTKHSNKAYNAPSSVSNQLNLDDCASECAYSADCFSFEFCEGMCTFGGYYTEKSTKYSPGCEVYSPKLSSKYELTGSNIVTEVLYTELDLNLDQCATLCFDYKHADGGSCQSFNYCPKSQTSASCQLTKHSVQNSKTVTTQSTICHNFELAPKSKKLEQKGNSVADKQTARITGSGAFGYIMLFLFIGLFVGFVGPVIVMKVKSSSIIRGQSNDFSWSRQIDIVENETELQI